MSGWQDQYEPVEDRIRAFWEDHPEGRITTELINNGDGDYIVRAEVYRLPPVTGASMTGGVQLPDATGYAHDSAAQLPANMKASALEVCETSAIGRALANLGYAPKGKRPSREEMAKSSVGAATPHPGHQRAASAETSSEEVGPETYGEGATVPASSVDPSMNDGDLHDKPTPHTAQWVDSPRVSKFEICAFDGCNATRRRVPSNA